MGNCTAPRQSTNCPDGATPYAGLVQGVDDFYGTTAYGGANGDGTVFKITPNGILTTLYSFCSQPNCTDGFIPNAGLVQGTDGNFYGATIRSAPAISGTLFRITPNGALTTLYTFSGLDGTGPLGSLLQATDGNFYGAANGGGANGLGTVFQLSVGLGPFVNVLPGFGKVGASVKILGTNLAGATSVTFNGAMAAFTVYLPSLIATTVPTGATTGMVQVTTPSSTLSSNVAFDVQP